MSLKRHLLAAVNNELNAVFITGDLVGNTMFYGPGAGQDPTASAVVSDIVDLARNMLARPRGECFSCLSMDPEKDVPLLPLDEVTNRFYLRLYTLDQPGILARISGVLGENKISISSVVQLETHGEKDFVPIVLLTHEAPEHALNKALMQLRVCFYPPRYPPAQAFPRLRKERVYGWRYYKKGGSGYERAS